MDLKIKDVAELLNVSETTIRRWLKDGKIPAYQLNHQYRFNKSEIEDWMMKCKLKSDADKNSFSPFQEEELFSRGSKVGSLHRTGTQSFSLYRAMNKGGVLLDVPGRTKEAVIRFAMQKAAPRVGLDPELITELLLDRESLMTTGLNKGIAVPHPRDPVLTLPGSDLIITVFPEAPVNYGSLDGQPVHTLFFLFSASDKTHLHLLSKIAHLSSDQTILDFFSQKPHTDKLLGFVKEWEAKIRL